MFATQALQQHGVDINTRDPWGCTIVTEAVACDAPEVLAYILSPSVNADAHAKNRWGFSPRLLALWLERTACCEALALSDEEELDQADYTGLQVLSGSVEEARA